MNRFALLAVLLAFCLSPIAAGAETPKKSSATPPPAAEQTQPLTQPTPQAQPAPPPLSSPRPRRVAAPGDDIDWLSEFGLGGNPTGPQAGEQMDREQKLRAHLAREEALERMEDQDPKRYKRLMKIRRLAIEYRRADDPKRKAAIEKELTPLVDEELRIQHENNKKRVAELERRLKEAKQVLDERENNWDKVVEFSVKEITGQNAYLRAVNHHDRHRDRNRRQR